jgi:Tfp pilus assembly protein PilX
MITFINKNKVQRKGAILIFSLALISFISVISITSYRLVHEQIMIASGTSMKEEAEQAAENAILFALEKFHTLAVQYGTELTAYLSDIEVTCIMESGNKILEEGRDDCDATDGYSFGDLITQSTTQRSDTACFAWGSSDKSVRCIEIIGKGTFLGTRIKIENSQEIKIYGLKSTENDVYEY